MYSGESPETWQYFDQPVSGSMVFGRKMPYYISEYGVSQLRGNDKDGVRTSPPTAKTHVRKDPKSLISLVSRDVSNFLAPTPVFACVEIRTACYRIEKREIQKIAGEGAGKSAAKTRGAGGSAGEGSAFLGKE